MQHGNIARDGGLIEPSNTKQYGYAIRKHDRYRQRGYAARQTDPTHREKGRGHGNSRLLV